ncbi:MAG: ABC transporter substrate-binding protein [Christensenellales bacterium]|jgi:branched-chain amino acid transport system substrate-binding protein
MHKYALKRSVAIVIALMMLLVMGLTACGAPATGDATAPPATDSTDTPDETEPATSEEGDILIGVSTAITGASPLDGERTRQGVELAVEEINAKGGVLGRKLKLVIEDDQNEAAVAVNVANKLMNEDIVAMLGPQKSGNAAAIQAIAAEKQVPFLTGGTSPSLVTFDNDYLFRIRASDQMVAQVAAKFAVEELDAKNIGILYNNDDYGTGGQKVVEAYLTEINVPFVQEGHNTGDKDSTGQLMKLKNAGVDAIVLWTHAPEAAVIVRQIQELGLNVPIVASPTLTNQDFLNLVDASMVEGHYSVADFSVDDPREELQDYVKNVKEKYDLVPELFMTTYYDGVYIIADAIERAGSTDREAVRQALMETKDLQGVMGLKSANELGELVHEATVVTIKDKSPVLMTVVSE